MKKVIRYGIPVAAVLLLSGVAMAGTTGGLYTAPKVSDSDITVDGKFDDAGWAKALAEVVDEAKVPKWNARGTVVTDAAPDNSADASLAFKAAYSDKFFYFMVQVNDQAYFFENETAVEWQEDTVELYFDGLNTGGSAHESGKDVQMRIAARTPFAPTGSGHLMRMSTGGDAWEKHGYDPGKIGETGKIVGNVTATGWTIEMSIPWDELAYFIGTPAPKIGFDIQLNDNDEGGSARQTQLHWSGDGNNWQEPDKFGVLVLEGRK